MTDIAFRLMCKRFGADMVYTEFVSSDALIRSVNKTQQKLIVSDEEDGTKDVQFSEADWMYIVLICL